MDSFYIGSGDTAALLAGTKTKAHGDLLRRFVSDAVPYYNALNSPLDALRTGAILEQRYGLILPEGYYGQHRVVCGEMDVLKCSLDFALLNGGRTVDFDELKTCGFNDFLAFEQYRDDNEAGVDYIRRKYRNNYNQVQFQLYCTGLESANITFLVVYSYDDAENRLRNIQPNEFMKFRVTRDKDVISQIKGRAYIFQQIKDFYLKR